VRSDPSSANVHYAPLTLDHSESFVDLAADLWRELTRAELKKDFENFQKSPKFRYYGGFEGRQLIAFIFVSIRSDYVEGSESSPVVYIEGIYVTPSRRNKRIGARLVSICEDWGRENGCTEIGSDAEARNLGSIDFHESLGFEKNEIVCFIKKIPGFRQA